MEDARSRSRVGFPGLRIGIGIHSGDVVIKECGASILITDEVRKRIGPGAALRPLPAQSLRGRASPVLLFEVKELTGTLGIVAPRESAAWGRAWPIERSARTREPRYRYRAAAIDGNSAAKSIFFSTGSADSSGSSRRKRRWWSTPPM